MNQDIPKTTTPQENLERRLTELAQSKSRLELVNRLLVSLSAVAGLDNMVHHILDILMQTVGAANVSVIFSLDDSWRLCDIYGTNRLFHESDNPDVVAVLASGKPRRISRPGMRVSYLGANNSVPVENWIFPLVSRDRRIGVVCMDGMQVTDGTVMEELLPFFVYAGLMLDHELSNYSLLAEAHRRLQNSETLYRTLFEQAPDGVVLWSAPDLRPLQFNSTAHAMLGYSREDFARLTVSDIEASLNPTDLAGKLDTLRREGTSSFETVHRTRAGDNRSMLVSLKTLELAGRPMILAIHRDITERKRLEAQLRQAQKMEAIGQLAGGVAHDFNNILTAMMMNLNLLQDRPNLDPEIQADANELMAQAQRAANLTRQLLLFSRQSVMEAKVVDLNELVANLLKMLGRLIGEHITVQFDRREVLPAVEADAGMLEQVLMNLAVNARDAMPKGGRLTIKIDPVQVDAARIERGLEVRTGLFLCLSVTDTGCGMDEATLKRLFEPFFTTKVVGQGTGLGLATVYGIVAQHRGWLEVESLVASGTTFRVYLPASAKTVKQVVESKPIVIPKQGGETLLVVEDEASVQKFLVRALRKAGYRVFEAANGREAMVLWRNHGRQIDLLLSDMVMSEGLTGLDLAEKLRADKPELKVIISSGYNAELAGHARPTAGGIMYLQKPYQIEVLSKTVRDCLDGAQFTSVGAGDGVDINAARKSEPL